ncbi:MAG: TetR family transcriptional regulator, partial [Myxococcales bacterium]
MFRVSEQSKADVTGSAIRAAREQRGLTLRGLAAQLEVSPATLSGIENGRTPLTVERLTRIAVLLDVPAARLLQGDVPEPPAVDEARGPGEWRHFDDLGLGPTLEAAIRLFVRRGFHATSMREIAQEAGVSVAGIYHHHPSKQHLLVALMDFTMVDLRWRILAARDEGSNP